MLKFILIGRLTEDISRPLRGRLPPVTTGSCQPQAATRVNVANGGSRRRILLQAIPQQASYQRQSVAFVSGRLRKSLLRTTTSIA